MGHGVDVQLSSVGGGLGGALGARVLASWYKGTNTDSGVLQDTDQLASQEAHMPEYWWQEEGGEVAAGAVADQQRAAFVHSLPLLYGFMLLVQRLQI